MTNYTFCIIMLKQFKTMLKPFVGVLNHRLVILCYVRLVSRWLRKRTHGYILVQDEYHYV